MSKDRLTRFSEFSEDLKNVTSSEDKVPRATKRLSVEEQVQEEYEKAFCSVGDKYFEEGDFKQAAIYFWKFVKEHKDNAYAHGRLGDCFGELGNEKYAKAYWKMETKIKAKRLTDSLG